MAFSFSRAARSRTATNSAFCSAVVRSFREGQSMLATVATQAARNSRNGAGGLSEHSWYVALHALVTKAIIRQRAAEKHFNGNPAMTLICSRARSWKNGSESIGIGLLDVASRDPRGLIFVCSPTQVKLVPRNLGMG